MSLSVPGCVRLPRPDRRSPEAQAYRRLYKTAQWQRIRAHQLSTKPLCEWCEKEGRITPATVCHHETPHRGDMAKFYAGPFVSLCAPHHDNDASEIERKGYSTATGEDGFPLDPMHPANRT